MGLLISSELERWLSKKCYPGDSIAKKEVGENGNIDESEESQDNGDAEKEMKSKKFPKRRRWVS